MVGVINGFRWAIIGEDIQIYWLEFSISLGLVALLFFSRIWYFRRIKKTFADVT